jgi:isoquinoline 1-oxidoreductase beta subunit
MMLTAFGKPWNSARWFGRRTALMQNYVRDAVLCSKAAGRPVKVIWPREDDVKQGTFRPAAAQKLEAGLTADGKLDGWYHKVATPAVIAFFNPLRWEVAQPNDVISMRGAESKFYGIKDFRADHIITERHARLSPYRGIGASYTAFAAEAFMDELAEKAGRDPLDFRLDLVADNPRGRHLLEKVAEMSDWRNRGDRALGRGMRPRQLAEHLRDPGRPGGAGMSGDRRKPQANDQPNLSSFGPSTMPRISR